MASTESYTSFFTGDELDYAIAGALGNKYRGVTTPGCHLIGDTTDKLVDLDDLLIPGKYTIYFYINGPEKFIDGGTSTDFTSFSVRPIYLQIFATGGDHLYQTIMTCAKLYWRDMWAAEEKDPTTGHIPWRDVDLGIEQAVITNNMEFRESGVDESLSQRMGTLIVDTIDKLQIGNNNLLDFTNGIFMYDYKNVNKGDRHTVDDIFNKYWNCSHGQIESRELSTLLTTYPKFPMFDDLDSDYITVFESDGTGDATFESYTTTTSGQVMNKIAVSSNTKYTASVYLVYDSDFLDYQDPNDPEAFITIKTSSTIIKTNYFKLKLMGSKAAYTTAGYAEPPENRYCVNHIMDNTDYDFEASDPATDGKTDWRDTYIANGGRFIREGKAASDTGYFRLTVTIDGSMIDNVTNSDISISFGFRGLHDEHYMFVLPKIEYGEFATQYNHSWADLYYYFTNCEEFFGVPIIKVIGDNTTHLSLPDNFEKQDSFVYNKYLYCPNCGIVNDVFEEDEELFCTSCRAPVTEQGFFNAEPVAIGGGGGFIVHTDDDLTITNSTDKTQRYTSDDNYTKLKISYKPDGENLIDVNDQTVYGDQEYSNKYPRFKSVLFLNKMNGELLYWDDLVNNGALSANGGFVSINKPFVIRECYNTGSDDLNGPKPVESGETYSKDYVGKNQFWLHKPHASQVIPGQDQSKAATIKYYDPDESAWFTAKADCGAVYYVGTTAPGIEWLGKFWINSTTNALYYSVLEDNQLVWKPIMSVWGANPVTH